MPPIEDEYSSEEAAAWEGHGVHTDRPRDENGRFVAAAEEPAPVVEQPVAEQPTPVAPAEQPASVVQPGAEPVAATPPANPAAVAPQGYVPQQALLEARRENARLAARTNAILQAQRQAPAAPAPLPSLETDPDAYMRELGTRQEALAQERYEAQQNREVDMGIEQDEALFEQAQPDYRQAAEHYARARGQELLMFHTPKEAQRIMEDEVRQVANLAWQRQVPAASMIYQMAQHRGYVPGQAATPATSAPAQAPAPMGPAPAAVIASIQAGQANGPSLSSAAGGGVAAPVDALALANMSDEDFDKYLQLGKKGASERFAAVGGR